MFIYYLQKLMQTNKKKSQIMKLLKCNIMKVMILLDYCLYINMIFIFLNMKDLAKVFQFIL